METEYNGHKLEITYQIEREYWVYWLDVKVDNNEVLMSKKFRLPTQLKIFEWIIEDIPVHILKDDFPDLVVYWGGVAIGMNVRDRIDIQSVLDYIRIHHDR